MQIIVCGSRTFGYKFEDGKKVIDQRSVNTLNAYLTGTCDVLLWEGNKWSGLPVTVYQGGADGADFWAKTWAQSAMDSATNEVVHVETRAQWDVHGRAAGPIRNQKQLDHALSVDDPDRRLAAFIDKPLEESRGTFDMVTRGHKAGLEVDIIRVYR